MSAETDRAIAKAIKHWQDNKWPALKSIAVSEWGLTVYWNRWNLREKDESQVSFAPVLFSRHYINVALLKALDADGKRLFADADRTELETEADPEVVQRIGAAIIRDLNGDYDAIKKDGAPKD